MAKLYLEYVDTAPAEAGGRKKIKAIVTEEKVECEDKANVTLLPVDIVELSPKLVDESGNEIAGSEKPAVAPKSTEMVERNPLAQVNDASTIRIAWRDMKVKIGKCLAGKKVTWSMTPLFTPWHATAEHPEGEPESAPRFRGKWGTAANAAHRNRFSASSQYGAHDFAALDPETEAGTNKQVHQRARTTVDDDGYTAIRVNLPPIGFNKARIRIEIENRPPLDLIDLEVSAVVVIDPGHGDADPGNNPRYIRGNGSVWRPKESEMVMDIANRLATKLRQTPEAWRGALRVKLTRANDNEFPTLQERPELAKEQGSDIFLSIHFNDKGDDEIGDDPQSTTRGTRVFIRSTTGTGANLNWDAEVVLARLVGLATIQAAAPFDGHNFVDADYEEEPEPFPHTNAGASGALYRECGYKVLSESYMGHFTHYTPIKAVLLEVDFLDHWDIDWLFNTGPDKADSRAKLADELFGAIRSAIKID